MEPSSSYDSLLYRVYLLLGTISNPNRGKIMAGPADIHKLAQHMNRANALTARAGESGSKGETVMNSFEGTLNRFDEHMGTISEYDKQLAAMIAAQGNGGPALEATFPAPEVVNVQVTSTSSLDLATGDPKR